ncbi:glycosyltransferase family 4 protein [Curtobacterium sp. S6]|uniref:glycosyltransferase family 4 protein n=1 Tax=Curtobacterium sp. S6 TaxID=1479623 RepID=UPI000A6EE3CA|nr:glycosyltransferase family 4 protein [Curtobacterium sp. S6]
MPHPGRIFLATNNGDISGGENMMFELARSLRDSGREVIIVGPSQPGEVIARARTEGYEVRQMPASHRRAYMMRLAVFGLRHRRDWIWCNGLVPSFALTAHPRRIVHLHQIPTGSHRILARIAGIGARARLAPSYTSAPEIPGSQAFPNWVLPVQAGPSADRPSRERPLRVGFVGRISRKKGLVTLARGARALRDRGIEVELHLGGGTAYVTPEETRRVDQALEDLRGAVTRYGFVRPQDLYPRIDVLVVPSEWGEVFGLVAAEAMSARMPLIVSDDGALTEVVGPEHPWIFPAGDADALARTVENFLNTAVASPGRVRDITEAAYERWRRLYSPDAGAERMRLLLDRLMPDGPHPTERTTP